MKNAQFDIIVVHTLDHQWPHAHLSVAGFVPPKQRVGVVLASPGQFGAATGFPAKAQGPLEVGSCLV